MTKNTQIAATLAAMTLAAAVATTSAQAQNTSGNQLGELLPASQVYGNEVISSDNQKVGNLNNLMVDIESGRVLYGVVAANKGRVAVAPEIFTGPLQAKQPLHVNVTKAKIEGAPQFSSQVDTPTGWGEASFVDQVYKYFGQSPWWQGSTPADQGSFHNVHKASQVIGMKVENVNNQKIGTINNIVVGLPQGRLAYLILSPASNLNLGNNLYVLPPQAFTLSPDKNHLVSNIDQAKLASAPHFDKGHWPSLSDPTFASQVYQYYGKQAWFQPNGGTTQPTGR